MRCQIGVILTMIWICVPQAWAAAPMQGVYRIGRMYVIRVEVAGEDALSREFTVSESGSITHPLLGELRVEGLSVSEIEGLVRRLLVERSILTRPTVSVSVREYRSQYVTVLGEVSRTGKYFLRGLTAGAVKG